MSPAPAASENAELRQFAGAYFHIAGAYLTLAGIVQIVILALAAFSGLRHFLEPATPWVLLACAALAPAARRGGEKCKRRAESILRRLEIADGLGKRVPRLEAEDIKEGASWIITLLAGREPLDLRPYASENPPGPTRLVMNAREASWWSKQLASELRRLNQTWGVALIAMCIAVLYGYAREPSDSPRGQADVAEFAAAVLVLVSAEGALKRAGDLGEFASASDETCRTGTELLARERDNYSPITAADALRLATEYYAAREAAPRLSTTWYRVRRRALNEAWGRVHEDGV